MTVKVTFNDFVLVNYKERELEVHCIATGYDTHENEVLYFADGSGQPAYDEFEVDDFEITKVIENGKEVTDYDKDELEELVYDTLYEESENGSEKWVYPEEIEDDYEDFD